MMVIGDTKEVAPRVINDGDGCMEDGVFECVNICVSVVFNRAGEASGALGNMTQRNE